MWIMSRARSLRSLLAITGALLTAVLGGVPALASASDWKVGYFTPSPHGTLSFASADALANGVATFNFTNQPNTALLATDHGGSVVRGDLSGKTITAKFDIGGAAGAFTYFGEGTASNPCAFPANVRLYFQTSNAGGFAFTNFWWSDTAFAVLANGTYTLTATVSPVGWSDWNGKVAADNAAAFNDAASHVTLIGLSYGGGCFFENGAGTADGSGTFNLESFEVT
jgi:hypothetical protein